MCGGQFEILKNIEQVLRRVFTIFFDIFILSDWEKYAHF